MLTWGREGAKMSGTVFVWSAVVVRNLGIFPTSG